MLDCQSACTARGVNSFIHRERRHARLQKFWNFVPCQSHGSVRSYHNIARMPHHLKLCHQSHWTSSKIIMVMIGQIWAKSSTETTKMTNPMRRKIHDLRILGWAFQSIRLVLSHKRRPSCLKRKSSTALYPWKWLSKFYQNVKGDFGSSKSPIPTRSFGWQTTCSSLQTHIVLLRTLRKQNFGIAKLSLPNRNCVGTNH